MAKHWVLMAALASCWMGGAQAAPILYSASLSGAAESPPVVSTGTGTAQVTLDQAAKTLMIDVSFMDLVGNVTAAHIHCCTVDPGVGNVGVASTVPSFPGFPTGVSAGSYLATFDLDLVSSWNPAFLTANFGSTDVAMASLAAGLASGRAYFNIHTSHAPGGEIRGFLTAAVPEPATLSLLGLGFGVLVAARRKRPTH